MTRGKPWPIDDEKLLKNWFDSGIRDLRVIAFSFDNKYSENAIYQKLLDLGLLLREEDRKNSSSSSSSSASASATISLELPDELPSVEEALRTLAAALKALETPGLGKSEVLRLRCIIAGTKIYKVLLADYVNYRDLETELLELRKKYAELAKKFKDV